MDNFIKFLKNFVKDTSTVRVVTTLTLLALGVHFLFIGIFKTDLLIEIFALDEYTIYRIWCIAIGIFLLFVGYAAYMQNKSLVNESIHKAKERILKEAQDIKKDLDKPIETETQIPINEIKPELPNEQSNTNQEKELY